MKSKFLLFLTSSLLLVMQGYGQKRFIPEHHSIRNSGNKKTGSTAVGVKTSTVSKPGKSKNYYWDSGALSWQYNDTSLYVYNGSGALTSETRRNGIPYTRTLNTYDAQGRLTEQLYQNWLFSNTWVNSNRTVYIYNNQGYQIENRYDNWNTTTNAWEILYGNRNVLTYNVNNRITDNIYQNWNSTSNVWENNYRETAILYDGNGNLTQYDGKVFNGTTWDDDSRFKLTYSLNNQPVEAIYQTWSGSAYVNAERYTNLTWKNWCGFYCNESAISSMTMQAWGSIIPNQWNTEARMSTTYDAFGGSVELYQDYLLAVWVNNSRYTLSFDSHLNSTGNKSESWNVSSSSWDIDGEEKIIHTYDASFNITQSIWQYWDNNTNALQNNERRDYFNFQVFTSLPEQERLSNDFLYPNPCKSTGELSFKGIDFQPEAQNELIIFNVQGKAVFVKEFTGNTSSLISSDLSNGLYYYTLKNNHTILAKGKLFIE
jgi:YD repeat-containing protein